MRKLRLRLRGQVGQGHTQLGTGAQVSNSKAQALLWGDALPLLLLSSTMIQMGCPEVWFSETGRLSSEPGGLMGAWVLWGHCWQRQCQGHGAPP